MVLEKLQPGIVWNIFENLLVATPRPSKKTEKIRNAIKNWVSEQNKKSRLNFSIFEDAAGNLLIQKSATPGMESVPSILLQAHMDMVTETDRKDGFDFDNLSIPIRIQENGEWIDADGTTLGADDGIGVALALAIISNGDNSFTHGPLEVLITVDEEIGLVGALKLDVSVLPIKSKFMINIDSEQFGTIIIGSAGSGGTILTKQIPKNDLKPAENYAFLELKAFGLIGGHSGAEIHLPRANANKLIARLLTVLINNMDVYISNWNGGRKSSAITRESTVEFAIPTEKKDLAEKLLNDEKKIIISYYKNKTYNNEVIEPNIDINWKFIPSELCFSLPESKIIVSTANIAPHGVIKFSPTVKNLVETSNNLAIIKTNDDEIAIQLSSRSNKDSEKESFRKSMYQLGQLGNWNINQSHSYFAWEPDPNSKFPQFFKEYYKKSFGPDVQVTLIHAGLETGIIGGKIPGLQMIAIGPDVKDLHTPNERLNIKSVEILYEVLKNVISNFGKFDD